MFVGYHDENVILVAVIGEMKTEETVFYSNLDIALTAANGVVNVIQTRGAGVRNNTLKKNKPVSSEVVHKVNNKCALFWVIYFLINGFIQSLQ